MGHSIEYWRALEKERQKERKILVMTHYGNGIPKCVLCGFNDIRALSLDHIDGKGAEDRRNGQRIGGTLYRHLIKANYPLGFRTLCMNCQWIEKDNYNKRKDKINYVWPLFYKGLVL